MPANSQHLTANSSNEQAIEAFRHRLFALPEMTADNPATAALQKYKVNPTSSAKTFLEAYNDFRASAAAVAHGTIDQTRIANLQQEGKVYLCAIATTIKALARHNQLALQDVVAKLKEHLVTVASLGILNVNETHNLLNSANVDADKVQVVVDICAQQQGGDDKNDENCFIAFCQLTLMTSETSAAIDSANRRNDCHHHHHHHCHSW